MAQIKEYNAPSGEELRPSDLGESSLVRAARTIGAEGNQAAQMVKAGSKQFGAAVAEYGMAAEKHASFQEISQGASSFSALRDANDAVANAAFKDPSQNTDPALGARINAQVQPNIDKWVESFHTDRGREWALGQADHYKQSFQTRLAADTSTMAGIAATGHLNDWLKNSSNIVERDPTSLDQERAMVKPTVDALIQNLPGMSAADAAKFREEHSQKMLQQLDTVALNKLALNSPGHARQLFESGQFPNADPVHAEQVLKMGDSVARQNAAADRANQRFAEEERNDTGMRATVQQIGKLTQAAQSGDPAALQKLKDLSTQILIDGPKTGMKGTSTWQTHEMMLQSIQKLSQRSDVQTDKGALADLTQKMLNPDGPQATASDIVKLNLDGKLSDADTHERLGLLNAMKTDPTTQTFMKQFQDNVKDFEPLIKGAPGADVPGLGSYRYGEFMNDHLKAFQEGLQQGVSAKDMLDPSKSTYIFKDVKDYMVKPMDEQTIFGKPFTLQEGPMGAVTPVSVRMMEAFREQERQARDRKAKMDALTNLNIEDRTTPAPAPEMTRGMTQ